MSLIFAPGKHLTLTLLLHNKRLSSKLLQIESEAMRMVPGAYGVVVSMFDFHCSDRGSNPGRGGKIS